MKRVPLAQTHMARLRFGQPLPWNVRDAQGQLLLARGHMVSSETVFEALLLRGAYVDIDPGAGPAPCTAKRPVEPLGARYASLLNSLAWLLLRPSAAGFLERVGEMAEVIMTITRGNVDQLIFLIIRHDHGRFSMYGAAHSLHVATVCSLLAHRLRWPPGRHATLVRAALTMNLSIIKLQGILAARVEPLTEDQRALIRAHPLASADLLRDEAGLCDERWLAIVEQHHEEPGGGGYPRALHEPLEDAQALRFIDQFTAKHARRADRGVVPAPQVARDLYVQSAGHPLAALLIKKFGIFPPGCFVKLASGETAVVVRRGAEAGTPVAAVLIDANGGVPSGLPVLRDTAQPDHAITASLDELSVPVFVLPERFYHDA